MNEILVIEDEPTVSTPLSLILSRYGWVVKIAESLADGLSLIRARFFPVVWLDLSLVDSSWRQTFDRLPEILAAVQPGRLIVCSQHIPENVQFPHGVRVLYKPASVEQILAVIGDPTPT